MPLRCHACTIVGEAFGNLKRKFTQHPTEHNQSYLKHLGNSLLTAGVSLGLTFKYAIHGCFPCAFSNLDCE